MNGLTDMIAREARLRILKELAAQTDGRLSELMIRPVLDMYGIRRDRDWIATQLRKLEQLGAIELSTVGETLVAKLTRAGRDHVDERGLIEGVARPLDID